MSDKRYRVTYTGSDVVRLGRGGVFMAGTAAWCDEELAREAAARGDFNVEGLDSAEASAKPVPAAASASAPAAASAPAPKAEAKPEAKAEKKAEKPAEAAPAEAKKE